MRRIIFVVVALAAAVGVCSVAQPVWLYVRLVQRAIPLVESSTLFLGDSLTIERPLLQKQQQVSALVASGKLPQLSWLRRSEIARAEEPLLRTVCVRYDGNEDPHKLCRMLMTSHPLVEYAEPVRRQRLLFVPNDPLVSDQQYLQAIEAPAAWDVTTGSASVLIGISDSGVRITHEDLRDAIAINTGEIPNNGRDDDGNGYVDDYRGYNISWRDDGTAPDNVVHPTDGHGTSVAGIVVATQNNGKGISGIAPGCRIVPIKATPNSADSYILFGYESLLYAAIRGCKVVNCSWGNEDQAPSPIEENIVAYVVARDVAIVAASGNGTATQPMYPAAYPGVLGVGETELDGSIVPGTGIGPHCKILAPGSNARTTGNTYDADYTYFSGTSSATPMVAAVVALVRSRYPQLSALQALEHVRLSTRDVSATNPDVSQLLPGMVNARLALQRDPFSTPAIAVTRVEFQRLDGTPVDRGQLGDTLLVYVHAINRLGSGMQLQWTLQVIQSWGGESLAVRVLDGTYRRNAVAAGEEILLGPFSVAITGRDASLHFLRLSVTGRGSSGAEYHDVTLVPFYPTPDWVTIHRDSALLSVGDWGWLGRNSGSGQAFKGEGLTTVQLGSLLYGGGVFAVHFPTERVRSGIEGDGAAYENDFVPTEILHDQSISIRRLHDTTNAVGEAIGIALEERFEVLDRSTIYIRAMLSNRTGAPLENVAIGYFFDFDLTPSGDSSMVTPLLEQPWTCAEMMERMPGDPIVVALVRSSDTSVQLQCAGLDAAYARIGSFPPERKMESLRRGTSLQFGGLGDKSIVVGARYPFGLQPGEQRTVEVYILLGRNREELHRRASELSSVSIRSTEQFHVYPEPADGDAITAECLEIRGSASEWDLMTLDGRIVARYSFTVTPPSVHLPLSSVSSGVYVLSACARSQRWSRLIVRVR
ncbi:MAG: S8 family serine peptidase [Chlorobi bacterium]|nr:S8 family serine peptidase [Chlorobiota bacterium]